MSGPHRNPDRLNSIGIVVVGICGAVLVYVSIVALQAFYMDDSSEIQTMQDYGGQDTTFRTQRAQQLENLQKYEPKPASANQTYSISIDDAIPLVVRDAKKDPSNMVPAIGPAVTPTVKPIYGRPQPLQQPGAPGGAAPGGVAPGGGSAAPADGAGAGSAAPMTPTGGQGPGGGAPPGTEGPALKDPSGAPTRVDPAPRTNPSPKADPGPNAPKLDTKAAPAPAAPKQPAPGPAQPKKGNAS